MTDRTPQLAVVHTVLAAAIAAFRIGTSEWAGELPVRAAIDALGYFTALAAPGFIVSFGFRSSAARVGAAAVGMPISGFLGNIFGIPSMIMFGLILRSELRNRPAGLRVSTALAVGALLFAGTAALFLTTDPITWSSGGASNVIAWHEAAIAVFTTTVAGVLAWRNRDDRSEILAPGPT